MVSSLAPARGRGPVLASESRAPPFMNSQFQDRPGGSLEFRPPAPCATSAVSDTSTVRRRILRAGLARTTFETVKRYHLACAPAPRTTAMTSVEYTEEFEVWWNALSEREQNDVSHVVDMLAEHGPRLPYSYSSSVEQSRHGHMRELRVQSGGRPIRVLLIRVRPAPHSHPPDGRPQDPLDPFLRPFRSARRCDL